MGLITFGRVECRHVHVWVSVEGEGTEGMAFKGGWSPVRATPRGLGGRRGRKEEQKIFERKRHPKVPTRSHRNAVSEGRGRGESFRKSVPDIRGREGNYWFMIRGPRMECRVSTGFSPGLDSQRFRSSGRREDTVRRRVPKRIFWGRQSKRQWVGGPERECPDGKRS